MNRLWKIYQPLSFYITYELIPLLYITLFNYYFEWASASAAPYFLRCLQQLKLRATLPHVHDDDSGNDDFPDRVAYPVRYKPLLQSAEMQGRGCKNSNEEHTS